MTLLEAMASAGMDGEIKCSTITGTFSIEGIINNTGNWSVLRSESKRMIKIIDDWQPVRKPQVVEFKCTWATLKTPSGDRTTFPSAQEEVLAPMLKGRWHVTCREILEE